MTDAMTDTEIAASWALRGDLARRAKFGTGLTEDGRQRYLIADIGKIGKGDFVSLRVYRLMHAHDGIIAIEKELDSLYDALIAGISGADNIGGKY